MLVKLTNQVVDISFSNIKEIQKKSVWWDTNWTDNYIWIKYKTGNEYKIKCNSKEEVKKDYDTIVDLLNINSQIDKTYSLSEILELFEEGTRVIADNGLTYKLYYDEDEDAMYLFDTIVNNKLLKRRFKVLV